MGGLLAVPPTLPKIYTHNVVVDVNSTGLKIFFKSKFGVECD